MGRLGRLGGGGGLRGQAGALALRDVRLLTECGGVGARGLRASRHPAVDVGELRRPGEPDQEVGVVPGTEEQAQRHVGAARTCEERPDPSEPDSRGSGLRRRGVRLGAKRAGARLRTGTRRFGGR